MVKVYSKPAARRFTDSRAALLAQV